MDRAMLRTYMGLRPRPLAVAGGMSEHALGASIAEQADALVANNGVYVYVLDRAQTSLWLRAVHAAPVARRVRPDYAGLIADAGVTPVPLRLLPPAQSHQWVEAGQAWLDLAVGPWVLIRFRLWARAAVSERHLGHLTAWADEGAAAVAAARSLPEAR